MENTPAQNAARLPKLTAAQILAIPADQPELLYSRDAAALKHEYRQLAKIWYPDINKDPRAEEVFKHVDALRVLGEKKIASDTWEILGELKLTDRNGKPVVIPFLRKQPFALGTSYISEDAVTYVVAPVHKALFNNALETLKHLPFADAKMKAQYGRFLPRIKDSFAAKEGLVLQVEKDPELVAMKDVLAHVGGKMDPRHAAWMLSSLHDVACYLNWAGVTHNDIGPETVFVAPKSHYTAVLGGWWYATPKGNSLSHLPDRSFDQAPPDVLRGAVASPRIDLGLIRLTGRELLGEADGDRLGRIGTLPKPLTEWLRMPTSGDAQKDYRIWMDEILPESFGARRYVEMNVTFSDIYKPGEPSWAKNQTSTSPNTPSGTASRPNSAPQPPRQQARP